MFESMEITESIYEGVVEPSYKKPTRADANRAYHNRDKREESDLSNTCPPIRESAGKRRKRYVDHPKIESKTCILHGPGHSSNECKVLGDFGANYGKGEPTKDHGNHPTPRKNNRQLENNAIINNLANKILLN